jgi:hypothetical protein
LAAATDRSRYGKNAMYKHIDSEYQNQSGKRYARPRKCEYPESHRNQAPQ